MNLPRILISGFPGAGTSFLAHLVVEMGFNPGPAENLKGADDYNRWGYWEYLPIRNIAWSAIRTKGARSEKSFREYLARGFLEYADSKWTAWNDEHSKTCRKKIREMAAAHNIEMYKDNALPLVYPLFPRHARCVLATRKPEACYRRAARRVTYERFCDALACYRALSKQMAADVSTLFLAYEDFEADFEGQIGMLADFLGVASDTEHLRKFYRPRRIM